MKNESPQTPQVHITYDLELDGEIQLRELPFVAGVLADLSGAPEEPLPRLGDREFVRIDRDNFDRVLESARPRVVVRVPCTIQPDKHGSELTVALRFRSLADFSPEAVASQIGPVSELLAVRDGLIRLRETLSGKLQEILAHPNLLAEVLGDLEAVRNLLASHTSGAAAAGLLDAAQARPCAEDRASAAARLGDFFAEASRQDPRLVDIILLARVAKIDQAISRQLDEVLHHPDFQRLEATWRALWYFVDQTETSERLQLRVLNVSKRELTLDLEKAPEFDQSRVFGKVYGEVYGVRDCPPFAILIAGYYFDGGSRDTSLLAGLAQVVAAAQVVLIAGTSPQMFNVTRFSEAHGRRNMGKFFDTEAYAAWRQFRRSEDARFVGLVLPRMLLRLPYERGTTERFTYKEQLADHEHYLWGNAAFALGARITNAFARFGWCAAIRGVEGGGLASGLPVHRFRAADGNNGRVGPAELDLPERDIELARLGFVPLLNLKMDTAVFFCAPSCYEPKTYLQDEATMSARLHANLDYVLAASRFAHYLRCIMRDKNGTFMSTKQCETFLNRWIVCYTLPEDFPDPRVRAKCPLRDAKVEVTELADKPGIYRIVLNIVPGFQFEDMSHPMRLTFTLPE